MAGDNTYWDGYQYHTLESTASLESAMDSLTMDDDAGWELLNDVADIRRLIDTFDAHADHDPNPASQESDKPPLLYIDIEGKNLGRNGTIYIVQVHFLPTKVTYLLDVKDLGAEAFTTAGSSGRTFKDILEDESIAKVFWDVRMDSDALFNLYQVALAGVQDLQLMELCTRDINGDFKALEKLKSYRNAIDFDLPCEFDSETEEFLEIKAAVSRRLRDGDWEVFAERPLPRYLMVYCAGDVKFMAPLWEHYRGMMEAPCQPSMVLNHSARRIRETQRSAYYPDRPRDGGKDWSPKEFREHNSRVCFELFGSAYDPLERPLTPTLEDPAEDLYPEWTVADEDWDPISTDPEDEGQVPGSD